MGSVPLLLNAQTFTLFDPVSADFPFMKAKFYALGKDGRPLGQLKESDFTIIEQGQQREIESLVVPTENTFVPISAVLTLDISGSMTMEQRMTLAQDAARDWVNTIALDISECAITSFDDLSYVNQDFTRSRKHLLAAIDKIKPMNGTDYDKGLLASKTGAFPIAKRGTMKRVVVFLTDGLGGGTEKAIIEAARQDSITVYCITLGMKIPAILKKVADSTGGAWFENITTREELVSIYRRILFQAQNIKPGTIVWTSRPGCTLNRESTIRLNTGEISTSASITFVTPTTSLVRLAPTPRSVIFRDIGVGNSQGQRITLKATHQPVTIVGIETNNPRFTIGGITFPIRVESEETVTFTVGYVGLDSVPQVGRIDVRTDMCAPVTIFARATYGNRAAVTFQYMSVPIPERGAVLYSGADTVITWSGLMPSDNVALEYSLDLGLTWLPIVQQTSGLQYSWRVPPVPTGRLLTGSGRPMLVRVKQIWVPQEISAEPSIVLDAHYGTVTTARFSKDGTKILTASADRTAKIYDAYNGSVVQTFEGHGNIVSSASYSPDEKRVLTTGYDNTVRIWDAETGSLLNTAYGQGLRKFFFDQGKMYGAEKLQFVNQDNQRFLDGAFSPDGTEIIATTDNGMAIRWKGSLTRPVSHVSMFAGGWMYSAQYNHNGKSVITAGGDYSARIWTGGVSSSVRQFLGHTDQVTFACFSPDEKFVATASNDKTARIWDIATEKQVFRLDHNGAVSTVRYSPDGRRIATASLDGNIRLWDARTGALQLTLPGEALGFHDVDFSPDALRLVGAGVDGVARIWDIGGGFLQEATSQTFSVIAPQAKVRDLNIGAVMLGTVKDSVFAAIINPDKSVVRIMDIRITGAHAQDFSLVSGFQPFSVQSSSTASLEVRFAPHERGIRTATLEIVTWTDTLRATLRGEANIRGFEASEGVNFPTVLVHHVTDTNFTLLKNTGTLALTILKVQKIGPETEQFSFSMSKRMPFVLQPGESIIAKAGFAPTAIGIASGGVRVDIVGVQKPVIVPFVAEAVAANIATRLAATFIDNTGATLAFAEHDTIKAREVRTTLIRPLLNYIFFEDNSSEIPARYRLLTRNQTDRFDALHPDVFESSAGVNVTSATRKVKQVRGIEAYYQMLNIFGKRLASEPKLTARIIGFNSDIGLERGNIRLSQERAETVRNYLVNVWGIDEKRLKVSARNKPERASNNFDNDGVAENRRVEIMLEPQEAMSPVSADETLFVVDPNTVRFSVDARSEEPIAEWGIDMIIAPWGAIENVAKQQLLPMLSGTGTPPEWSDFRLSNREIRSIRGSLPRGEKYAACYFRLRVTNSVGQTSFSQTMPMCISVEEIREIAVNDSSRMRSVSPEEISRFALTFFDFDKATVNQQNAQILNIIKSRINPDTQATIIGYTDRVGDAAYNKRLSADRAKTVADLLAGVKNSQKVMSGVGESLLLYDNDLPEGRFYCRMVEIVLRNAPQAHGRTSP